MKAVLCLCWIGVSLCAWRLLLELVLLVGVLVSVLCGFDVVLDLLFAVLWLGCVVVDVRVCAGFVDKLDYDCELIGLGTLSQ